MTYRTHTPLPDEIKHRCDPLPRAANYPEGSITVCQGCGKTYVRAELDFRLGPCWRVLRRWPFDHKARRLRAQYEPDRARLHIGVECGQRWWRWRSWTGTKTFRRLPYTPGFAVGPIMFWRS